MITASIDQAHLNETMRRIEEGRHHLDVHQDKVEPMGTMVHVKFGIHLSVYVEGDKFWVGNHPFMAGRALPCLAAYSRAYRFLQVIQVVEKQTLPLLDLSQDWPIMKRTMLASLGLPPKSVFTDLAPIIKNFWTVAEELRRLEIKRHLLGTISTAAWDTLQDAALSLGYRNLTEAHEVNALPDVFSEAIEAAEAKPL